MHPHRHDVPTEEVTTTVDIAATPERVFSALTDPTQLTAWWIPPESIEPEAEQQWTVDPRPGGEWCMTTVGAQGERAAVHGEYLIVDAPRELVVTWEASWDQDVTATVRFHLTPVPVGEVTGTRLDVTHTSTHAAMGPTGIAIAPFNARDTIAGLAEYLLGEPATAHFGARSIIVTDELFHDTYTMRPWIATRGRTTIMA